MDDGINSGDPTDRLFAWWRLNSPAAISAVDRPDRAPRSRSTSIVSGRDVIEIELPDDIVAARAEDPEAAAQWRIAVREAFAGCLRRRFPRSSGSARSGDYVLERDR